MEIISYDLCSEKCWCNKCPQFLGVANVLKNVNCFYVVRALVERYKQRDVEREREKKKMNNNCRVVDNIPKISSERQTIAADILLFSPLTESNFSQQEKKEVTEYMMKTMMRKKESTLKEFYLITCDLGHIFYLFTAPSTVLCS